MKTKFYAMFTLVFLYVDIVANHIKSIFILSYFHSDLDFNWVIKIRPNRKNPTLDQAKYQSTKRYNTTGQHHRKKCIVGIVEIQLKYS